MRTNLLEETLEVLAAYKLTPDEVLWVGSSDGTYALSWVEFTRVANVSYDSGYGAAEVASDLVVVGYDWWLERYEYDGSEGWTYKVKPQRADAPQVFNVAVGGMWETLDKLNG